MTGVQTCALPISVFRPHGSGIPSEPIFFGEKTQDIVRKFIRLRYEMLPYNYSLAYENTLNGTPLARPVFLDESTPSASPTLQSYYWGPSLLVAPVTEPGKKTMKILFPKGKWYNWWTGETYEGQKIHNVALSPETYPLFAKGGSFVPMCPPLFNTDKDRKSVV